MKWTMAWLAGLALCATVVAEDKVKVQVGQGGVKVETPRGERDARSSMAIRASELIGMEVKNRANESLGKVNDLVIDGKGHVRYAAIQYGGVLGVGSKLFAVPYDLMHVRSALDADTHYFELNVDKAVFEKAPGFPSDKWPNFGDESFTKNVDKYYQDTASKPRLER